LAQGLTVLGFSDHTPLPDDRWPGIRMPMDELADYVQSIRRSRPQFPGLKLLGGMECEYFKEYHNFFKEELLGKWGLDYLIAGVHFYFNSGRWKGVHGGVKTRYELKSYAGTVIKSMEAGLFTFISHPDLFANSYLEWDAEARAVSRDMLDAAASYGAVLEINSSGFRRGRVESKRGQRAVYPLAEFWELASEYRVKVVVNSDAHSPEHIATGIKECMAMVEKFNLSLADLSYLEVK
jgi:histidinol-phosphatase (PHP family)